MKEERRIYEKKTRLQEQLFELQDVEYRKFHSHLMPTVDENQIIGIRIPVLRAFAREYAGSSESMAFLEQLPHTYYEENNLHGLLIEQCKEYTKTIALLDAFLPYVDNWATCDLIRPQIFRRHLPELSVEIRRWLDEKHTYTVRFGIEMLMTFYLEEAFQPKYLTWVAEIHSEEYYLNMMIAWFFATALAKQYDATLPYIAGKRLSTWTHNKTIQKAIESRRITEEQKVILREMKIPRK